MLKKKLMESGFIETGSAWVHPQIKSVLVVNPTPKTLIVKHLRADRTALTESKHIGVAKAEAAINALIKVI